MSLATNYVTANGFSLIEKEMVRLIAAYAQARASADRQMLATISRDLRYWRQRRASAQQVHLPSNSDKIYFGSTVTIRYADGRQQSWHIVGEDEADPRQNSVSYVSPLARALIGKAIGDVAKVGISEVEIVSVA